MRMRQKSAKNRLPTREIQIGLRLVEARRFLGLDQAESARKIGIPTSTLSNYEVGVTPMKADVALRACRKLILSEEWLATGNFKFTERVARTKNIAVTDAEMVKIYRRQCMDLLGSTEASKLLPGMLFSEAFDKHLAGVFEKRIQAFFYSFGIPATAWQDKDLELGSDLLVLMMERDIRLLMNEALRRGCSSQHAGSVYLGFLMRMALFGYNKCMGKPIDASTINLPLELFSEAARPITAFATEEELRRAAEFAPLASMKEPASLAAHR
jgi:transcriptional regulator with XRE-family HTH domain